MKLLGFHVVAFALVGAGALALAGGCSSSSGTGNTGDDAGEAADTSGAGADTGGGSDSGGDSAAAFPTIAISDPAASAAVTLTPPMDHVPVTFAVTSITLMAPGSCPAGSTATCGHIHVLIDGAACTPTGSPYDNAGEASPVDAIFSTCPTANGMHTITLEIHHDDHSPYLGANGMVIAASVTVTTSGG
jgi:hypothetical protein